MKKVILIFKLFLLLRFVLCSEVSIAQWYQINLPVSGSIYKMQFINHNTGWATIRQSTYLYSLVKSTNSGLNWFVIYSDSAKVGTIQFINDTIGYALGYANSDLLLKTTNGGYNWSIMQSSSSYVYSGFYMINADTGWVNAFYFPSQVTLRTTNGFQTLEQISTGGGGTPATLYFFKEKYNGEYCGYVLGAGILSKTTNSGFSWQPFLFSGFGNVNSFSFLNKDTGWIVYLPSVVQNSQILYTSNAGQDWVQQFITNTQGDFGNIQAINSNKIWCGEVYNNNKILVTTNSGLIWGYQSSPISYNTGIYFYDTLLGFAWSNLVVRTTNGGGPITQISEIKEQIANKYQLYQNYPNPFNSSTIFQFEILKSSIVNMRLYDVLGREVLKIIDSKEYNSGVYKVLINFDNFNLSSGIYYYKLFAVEKEKGELFQTTKKLFYSK